MSSLEFISLNLFTPVELKLRTFSMTINLTFSDASLSLSEAICQGWQPGLEVVQL